MSAQVMQQRTSRLLYHYWDDVRGDRKAPQRFEIEPSNIAALLAETFIIDCSRTASFRFRLAGTRICEYLGRELRGADLLDFWQADDREAVEGMLHGIVMDGSVGVMSFDAIAETGRSARFEMTLLPLIHSSTCINRILGNTTAVDPPYWLGSVTIHNFRLAHLEMVFPDQQPQSLQEPGAQPLFERAGGYRIAGNAERNFRVFEGGRSD